ncbi:MAG: putative DNA binding domain-containing protein [Methanomassiliicoccaceae archaeon]|nr:putative DNA binding domain-containing protein [Methanomassiliicoccaceae archaeon]
METQNRELKESWHPKYLSTLCAFANTSGGVMIIGISDNGDIIGVRNPQRVLKVIPDDIRNKLSITASVEETVEKGKTCIKITVGKGFRYVDLDGVFYKRVGNTTQRVTGDELNSWILSNMRTSWSGIPAKGIGIEKLSKDAIDFFVKKGLSSGRMSPKAAESDHETILGNYDLVGDEGVRNSAAILFLEEPGKIFSSASVSIGEFNDDDILLRLDLIDCPVVMLPDRVMDKLLNKYIKGVDDIVGLMRVTRYPYPEKALREAVMNSICHRDYQGVEQTYIRVYPDRIEVSNPGRLPEGWDENNIFRKHGSVPTNPAIARVFFEMGYIERFGSGIEMMRNECVAMNVPEPEYNMDMGRVEVVFRLPEKEDKYTPIANLTERESIIYALICKGDMSTIDEISEATGIPHRTVRRDVSRLIEGKYIQKVGGDRYGKWVSLSK